MNTDAPPLDLYQAERRVLEIQTKLHRWATGDPNCRFEDLFNPVVDPSCLLVAWCRVRGNGGPRQRGRWGRTALHRLRQRGVPVPAAR